LKLRLIVFRHAWDLILANLGIFFGHGLGILTTDTTDITDYADNHIQKLYI